MGKFFNNLIGVEDNEDEDLDEYEDDEYEDDEEEEKPKRGFFGKLFGSSENDEDDEDEEEYEPVIKQNTVAKDSPIPQRPNQNPPISRSTNTINGKQYTQQVRLVVIKPVCFDESPKLVDSLKARKPIIINLEDLESDIARKIFDFLSGATYALNGTVQKVANNIFLFAPENVEVKYTNSASRNEVSETPWS